MYWTLLKTFFLIGLLSIGGGYAIIPLIQEQVVEHYGWISQQVFTDIITISQMTPGPLAVNTSTFIGIQTAGIPGAVLATVGCVFAGVCISTALYRFFQRRLHSAYVLEVLNGLKAASLGLIVSATASILLLAFTGAPELSSAGALDWTAVLLFSAGLPALRKWKLNPMLLIALTGAAGVLLC